MLEIFVDYVRFYPENVQKTIVFRSKYRKENNMKFEVGDKVNIKDVSYSFGFSNGEFNGFIPFDQRENLTIIETGLSVTTKANGYIDSIHYMVNDLALTNGEGGFWFTQSRFCEPVDKQIEVRYFCNGRDVTDNISEETKRNLRDS
jgi:hypothetical protein